MKEKESRSRALICQSHLRSVGVHMEDGKSCTIPHPECALIAEGALLLVGGPDIGLGHARFTVCGFDHVTRVESLQSQAAV